MKLQSDKIFGNLSDGVIFGNLSDGVSSLRAERTPAEGAEGTDSKGARVAERTPAEGTGTGGIGSGGGRVHTHWATSGTDDVCRLPVGSLYTRA